MVRASTQQAVGAGVTGVPAFVLDERLLVLGAHPRETFERETAAMRSVIERGGSLREFTRDALGRLDGRSMLRLWRDTFRDMCDRFAALDPPSGW